MCSPLFLPKPVFVYTNALHFQKTIEGLSLQRECNPCQALMVKTNTDVQTSKIQFIFQLATMISDVTKHNKTQLK